MDYGSSLHRLTQSASTLIRAGGTIVAVCQRQLVDGVLHAVDLDSGQVSCAEPVKAFAVGADRVVAVPCDAPDRLRIHALPALTLTGEVPLGAKASAVAVGPTAVAAALADGAVALLGAAADGEVRRVAVEAPRVLAFSPDGAWLAVGLESGRVALVDVGKGVVARTLLGGRAPVLALAWSADGGTVAAASAKSALVWPAAGGKATSVFKAKLYAIVVGFHGRLLIIHDPQNVIAAVDVDTQHKAWELPQYGPAILRGDRVLAARMQEVREIDAGTGEILRRVEAPSIHVNAVEARGDQVVLAMSTGTRLLLGDLATGEVAATPPGHDATLLDVHFAGERFATGSADTHAMVWARGQAAPLAAIVAPSRRSTGRVHAVHLDGDTLWAAMGSTLHRFRISSGAWEASATLKDDVRVIAPVDGVLLAAAECSRRTYGELSLLDPVTLELLHAERIDRTFVRAAVQGARVRLHCERYWSAYDVRARAFVAHGGPAEARARTTSVSGDGAVLVEVKMRDQIATWWASDMATGALRVDGQEMPLLGDYVRPELSLSLDERGERLATAHRDGRVRVWDAHSGARIAEIDRGGAVSGVRWFPDGQAILAWNDWGALWELPVAAG